MTMTLNCRSELVTGYLDDALDLPDRHGVEAHLGECAPCRVQLAGEQHVRQLLRRAESEDLPRGLERRLQEALQPRRLSWLQVLVPFGAVLLFGVLIGRGEPWFVARELVADHKKCFNRKNIPAKVWSEDMNLVARWFYRQGAPLPYLPERNGDLALLGGRFCPLADLSLTPHLYYEDDETGKQVSIFVMNHDVRFSPHYRARVLGTVVGMVRVGPTVIGVVGSDEETVRAFEGAILRATAYASR